jgi:hypothetical protein
LPCFHRTSLSLAAAKLWATGQPVWHPTLRRVFCPQPRRRENRIYVLLNDEQEFTRIVAHDAVENMCMGFGRTSRGKRLIPAFEKRERKPLLQKLQERQFLEKG